MKKQQINPDFPASYRRVFDRAVPVLVHKKENSFAQIEDALLWFDLNEGNHTNSTGISEVYIYRGWLFYRFKGKKRYYMNYFNTTTGTNSFLAMEKLIRTMQPKNG